MKKVANDNFENKAAKRSVRHEIIRQIDTLLKSEEFKCKDIGILTLPGKNWYFENMLATVIAVNHPDVKIRLTCFESEGVNSTKEDLFADKHNRCPFEFNYNGEKWDFASGSLPMKECTMGNLHVRYINGLFDPSLEGCENTHFVWFDLCGCPLPAAFQAMEHLMVEGVNPDLALIHLTCMMNWRNCGNELDGTKQMFRALQQAGREAQIEYIHTQMGNINVQGVVMDYDYLGGENTPMSTFGYTVSDLAAKVVKPFTVVREKKVYVPKKKYIKHITSLVVLPKAPKREYTKRSIEERNAAIKSKADNEYILYHIKRGDSSASIQQHFDMDFNGASCSLAKIAGVRAAYQRNLNKINLNKDI